MRKYELMTIFPIDEEKSKKAVEEVRGTLTSLGAEIEEEKVFGDRDLAYEIDREKKGHFVLFTLKLNPDKITEVDKAFKIQKNLLKYLFVKLEEK